MIIKNFDEYGVGVIYTNDTSSFNPNVNSEKLDNNLYLKNFQVIDEEKFAKANLEELFQEILKNVTKIEMQAFEKTDKNFNEKIDKIIIPNGVKNIEPFAFYDCANLKEVKLNDEITVIEQNAFCKCNSLKEIKLPKNLQKIDNDAFNSCSSLEKIDFPENLETLGEYAFVLCQNLREINFNKNLKKIGSDAFLDCKNLKEVVLPDSLEELGEKVFTGCTNLSKITIPNGIKSLGSDFFAECPNIEYVKLPISCATRDLFIQNSNLKQIILTTGDKEIPLEAKDYADKILELKIQYQKNDDLKMGIAKEPPKAPPRAPKPVAEPVIEPVAEPTTEPNKEPVAEPVEEPVAEPVEVSPPFESRNGFTIAQKVSKNGKQTVVGEQKITLDGEENCIHIGKNFTKANYPVCSIVYNEGQSFLVVDKRVKELDDLTIFADINDEKYSFYKIKNTTMLANEDISFQLENPSAKSFGTLTIKSNGIVHEKQGVLTNLINTNDNFLDIELPINFSELTKDDAPIRIKESKTSNKFGLPAQMFDNLKTLADNGDKNIKIKEWKNIGKKGQVFRAVLYGDKILVGDGSELKEVEAGFKVVPDKNEVEKLNGKQDLIIKFNKSSKKIGETKNSKLIDGLNPEIVEEIINFLPEKYKSGEQVVEKSLEENIENVQIESIGHLNNPKNKFGIVNNLDMGNTIVSEPETTTKGPEETEKSPEEPAIEKPEEPIKAPEGQPVTETPDEPIKTPEEPVTPDVAIKAPEEPDAPEGSSKVLEEPEKETITEEPKDSENPENPPVPPKAPEGSHNTEKSYNTPEPSRNFQEERTQPIKSGERIEWQPKKKVSTFQQIDGKKLATILLGFTVALGTLALLILSLFVPGMMWLTIFSGLALATTASASVASTLDLIKDARAKAYKEMQSERETSYSKETKQEKTYTKEDEKQEKKEDKKKRKEIKKQNKLLEKEARKKEKETRKKEKETRKKEKEAKKASTKSQNEPQKTSDLDTLKILQNNKQVPEKESPTKIDSSKLSREEIEKLLGKKSKTKDSDLGMEP